MDPKRGEFGPRRLKKREPPVPSFGAHALPGQAHVSLGGAIGKLGTRDQASDHRSKFEPGDKLGKLEMRNQGTLMRNQGIHLMRNLREPR